MSNNNTTRQPDPIFEIGPVPQLPHCSIQNLEFRNGKWVYFICNSYNSYASGWGDEDFIIQQIEKNGNK